MSKPAKPVKIIQFNAAAVSKILQFDKTVRLNAACKIFDHTLPRTAEDAEATLPRYIEYLKANQNNIKQSLIHSLVTSFVNTDDAMKSLESRLQNKKSEKGAIVVSSPDKVFAYRVMYLLSGIILNAVSRVIATRLSKLGKNLELARHWNKLNYFFSDEYIHEVKNDTADEYFRINAIELKKGLTNLVSMFSNVDSELVFSELSALDENTKMSLLHSRLLTTCNILFFLGDFSELVSNGELVDEIRSYAENDLNVIKSILQSLSNRKSGTEFASFLDRVTEFYFGEDDNSKWILSFTSAFDSYRTHVKRVNTENTSATPSKANSTSAVAVAVSKVDETKTPDPDAMEDIPSATKQPKANIRKQANKDVTEEVKRDSVKPVAKSEDEDVEWENDDTVTTTTTTTKSKEDSKELDEEEEEEVIASGTVAPVVRGTAGKRKADTKVPLFDATETETNTDTGAEVEPEAKLTKRVKLTAQTRKTADESNAKNVQKNATTVSDAEPASVAPVSQQDDSVLGNLSKIIKLATEMSLKYTNNNNVQKVSSLEARVGVLEGIVQSKDAELVTKAARIAELETKLKEAETHFNDIVDLISSKHKKS
jgi:hypothetical protein